MSNQTTTGLARVELRDQPGHSPIPLLAMLAGLPLLGFAGNLRRLRRCRGRWMPFASACSRKIQMRFDRKFLLTATLALSAARPVHAQQTFGIEPGQVPVLETSFGYSFLHANAQPGQCGCFSANGGFGSVVFNAPHGFSIVANLNAVHAGNIAGPVHHRLRLSLQSALLSALRFQKICALRTSPRRLAGALNPCRLTELTGCGVQLRSRRHHRTEAPPRVDHLRWPTGSIPSFPMPRTICRTISASAPQSPSASLLGSLVCPVSDRSKAIS